MSMQDTGFVQIPVSRFLELIELEKRAHDLNEELKARELREKRFVDDNVKITATRSNLKTADDVIVMFKDVSLLNYFGIDKRIRKYRNVGVPINSVQLYIESKYEDIQQFIKEVNE